MGSVLFQEWVCFGIVALAFLDMTRRGLILIAEPLCTLVLNHGKVSKAMKLRTLFRRLEPQASSPVACSSCKGCS